MTMMMKSKLSMAKAVLLTVCAASAGTLAMHAQDAPPPPPAGQTDQQGPPMGGPGRGMGSERQMEMMTKHLNLTSDQVTKLKAIDADDRQQMMSLRNDTSLAQSDRHSKMMALRQDREAKINAMLTEEQKAKYADMQAKMREHRMERQNGGNGDAPPPPPQQ